MVLFNKSTKHYCQISDYKFLVILNKFYLQLIFNAIKKTFIITSIYLNSNRIVQTKYNFNTRQSIDRREF